MPMQTFLQCHFLLEKHEAWIRRLESLSINSPIAGIYYYTHLCRLTVQQGEANESCEEKIVCIRDQVAESDSSGQEFEDSPPAESGSGSYDYYDEDNSFHSKPEHPTLSDDQDLDEEDNNKESTEVSLIGSPTCNSDREFFLSFNFAWIPHCDCQGFYEPVQCWTKGGQLECWCSTRTGSLVANTRTVISCTDLQQL